MPTLRKRLLVDQWVAIAPERADRPRGLGLSLDSPDEFCPFCPTDDNQITPPPVQDWSSPAYPDAPWGIRAVPNKYPALRVEEQLDVQLPDEADDHPYLVRGGAGAHEVLIETPDHRTDWRQLTVEHITRILAAWQQRLDDLAGDRRLRCGLPFKNHGAVAGATLEHTHSQVIALPMVPPLLNRELAGARDYFDKTGDCELCKVVEYERTTGGRLVLEDDRAVVLAPFGSRMAFETWILPTRHQGNYLAADTDQLRSVADKIRRIIELYGRALGDVAYNLVLHTLPFDLVEEPYYHWHLELLPRTGQIAGLELGTDVYVNATPSEVAARHLRTLCDAPG